jgi:hypothetical protein
MTRNARSTLSGVALHAGRISSPLPKIVLGVVLLAFFTVGSVLHIQTSEAFFLMGQTVRLSPNWSVLAQPWQLMNGQLDPKMAETTMWGWGIELVFLICVVGFEIAHDGIAASSRKNGRPLPYRGGGAHRLRRLHRFLVRQRGYRFLGAGGLCLDYRLCGLFLWHGWLSPG